MNILLFTEQDLNEQGHLILKDERFEHLTKVQDFQVGDEIHIGKINGRVGSGSVLERTKQMISLSVSLTHEPPDKAGVHVFLALPRPKMLKRILMDLAMVGVNRIHIINSYHVQKSYWQSPLLKPEQLRQYLMKGLEQSCDTLLPEITLHKRFRPFVEDHFSGLQCGTTYLADPRAKDTCPHAVDAPFSLIIGPENGFTHYEIQRLREFGARGVTFGPRHLRAETAANFLLGRLIK